MSQRSVHVRYVEVDTTKADEELKHLQEHAQLVSRETLHLVRKSYSTLALLGDIMGYAIPQWFNLMFSAAMMAVETFRAMAAAETMTIYGAGKAVLSFTASVLMFMQAMIILQAGTQADRKLNSIISLLNLWS